MFSRGNLRSHARGTVWNGGNAVNAGNARERRERARLEGSRFGTPQRISRYFSRRVYGHKFFLQAAPANDPAQCFHPAVGSITHFTHAPRRQTTRWVVRGSRRFKKICGHTRCEKNSARSLGCDPKRLPSRRSLLFVTRQPPPALLHRNCLLLPYTQNSGYPAKWPVLRADPDRDPKRKAAFLSAIASRVVD